MVNPPRRANLKRSASGGGDAGAGEDRKNDRPTEQAPAHRTTMQTKTAKRCGLIERRAPLPAMKSGTTPRMTMTTPMS
jgi:hypothetical protein